MVSKIKKHLVLDWHFNLPTQELSIQIEENLKYIAHEGGNKGYTKIYEGVETTVTQDEWEKEKYWISEHYGEEFGYFQPDFERFTKHPTEDRMDHSPMGVGPDGFYLDHMQRRQTVLDGDDQAKIGFGLSGTLYTTVDKGKTIFKREAHRNVLYGELEDPAFDHMKWTDHSQPCAQQPYAQGCKISSYKEMMKDGIDSFTIERCELGNWDEAPKPELQELYTYPKSK